jgi:hypothetical protein
MDLFQKGNGFLLKMSEFFLPEKFFEVPQKDKIAETF